jgi:hypothetical protein
MHTTLTTPQWKKTSIEMGQPSTSHYKERREAGEKETLICHYRIWAETAKEKERV